MSSLPSGSSTTGGPAQRYGRGWDLLVLASRTLDVEVRRVSGVLADAYDGQLAPADASSAVRTTALLPVLTRTAEESPT